MRRFPSDVPSAVHPRYRRYLPPALPPLPPALTAATASTTAATGVVVAATAAAALPVATGTAAAATTAALAPLAAAANRHGCSATSDLTHRRCLCYRRRSTVAIAVCWNVVSFCVWCDVTGPER